MKDVKSHTMASEYHNPAASVFVISLKCVLYVAMRMTSDKSIIIVEERESILLHYGTV